MTIGTVAIVLATDQCQASHRDRRTSGFFQQATVQDDLWDAFSLHGKPSLARAIAAESGKAARSDDYLCCGNGMITRYFGHMLEPKTSIRAGPWRLEPEHVLTGIQGLLPLMKINPAVSNLLAFTYDNFVLEGHEAQPSISALIAI